MSLTIQERHLIDRYLQGELSGLELENFLLRISGEEALKREVELQTIIYNGIHKAKEERLKKLILTAIDYRKPVVPFALKMIITFFGVVAMGITVWLYVGDNSSNKKDEYSWLTLLDGSKSKHDTGFDLKKNKKENSQKIISGGLQPDTSSLSRDVKGPVATVYDSLKVNSPDPETQTDSIQTRDNAEDIIIKQDQLIISATLEVTDKSKNTELDKIDSLTNVTVEKLNPAAGLPEEVKPAPNYSVEFWVSPINYRGYKMSKNKLVLFGIEEPDAVKLYRVNDAIYMSYLKDYYRLNSSFEFMAYQKLKDSEIPPVIK